MNASLKVRVLFNLLTLTHCLSDVDSLKTGFEKLFRDQLLTVFSASNYCGVVNNKGAFVIIEPDLTYEIVQYEAKPMQKMSRHRMRHAGTSCIIICARRTVIVLKRYSLGAAMENDVISKLLRRIAENRLALADFYQRQDVDKTGLITRGQWYVRAKVNSLVGVDVISLVCTSAWL